MAFTKHIIISIIGNRENMWGHFRLSFAFVATYYVVVVHGKPLIRVDRDTEEPRVGVDQKLDVSRKEKYNNYLAVTYKELFIKSTFLKDCKRLRLQTNKSCSLNLPEVRILVDFAFQSARP